MKRLTGTLVGVIWLGLAGATPGAFAHGGDPTLIHACKSNLFGTLRIVAPNTNCTRFETAIDWSITGPAGPTGATGPTGPQGPAGPAFPIACPPDSVLTGTTCIDIYEASVWQTTDANVIKKIKDGTVTLSDLNAAGATQRGVSSDDYGASCPDTGKGCLNVYAVSIPGVTPSRFITWFQAAAAARNSGKRLPTNAEWQVAALGTPDTVLPGPGPADCNTFGLGGPDLTGARANCVSDVGASDMVGNIAEWVAEWSPFSGVSGWSALFSDDGLNTGYATTDGSRGGVRGGAFDEGANGRDAGPFSGGFDNLSIGSQYVGFRAAR